MSETTTLLALVVTGLLWVVSGVVLGWAGRFGGPPVAAAALTVAGLGTVAGVVADRSGHPAAVVHVVVVAWAIALPLAVVSYPRWSWRHPVDFVALATVVGAGALLSVQTVTEDAVTVTVLVIVVTLIAHTWWAVEHADARGRSALAWLAVVGVGAGMLALVLVFLAPTDAGLAVGALAFALVGPAMVVGAARPEIVDVRLVVVQVVVVASAMVVYLALFVGLASLLEIVLGRPPTTGELAVVGALAALALPPLRTALRGVVDELLFGVRSDPLEAATHVAGRSSGDPVLALRGVREALGLPYAVLRVDGVTAASSGVPSTASRTIALTVGEAQVGELEVGLRPGGLSLSAADEHVLTLLAPLLVMTARSTALALQLQQAREQSVTAIEEERRRLRRDLHDGLGPRLSGIAFTADAARNSVRVDPGTAEALLTQLRAETATAIDEIRQLVYAMRPPALDELGLVQAIRQQALALRTPSGAPLRLELVTPEVLPALTAAVEVAAYRITIEALANAARHSGSDRAVVRLWPNGTELEIEVFDGGESGTSPSRWGAGVGTSSMRERAQELGGSLESGPTARGGMVRARLPIS